MRLLSLSRFSVPCGPPLKLLGAGLADNTGNQLSGRFIEVDLPWRGLEVRKRFGGIDCSTLRLMGVMLSHRGGCVASEFFEHGGGSACFGVESDEGMAEGMEADLDHGTFAGAVSCAVAVGADALGREMLLDAFGDRCGVSPILLGQFWEDVFRIAGQRHKGA